MLIQIYKDAFNNVSNNSELILKDYQTTKDFLLLALTGYFLIKIIK